MADLLTMSGGQVRLLRDGGVLVDLDARAIFEIVYDDGGYEGQAVALDETLADVQFDRRLRLPKLLLDGDQLHICLPLDGESPVIEPCRDHCLVGRRWIPLDPTETARVRNFFDEHADSSTLEKQTAAVFHQDLFLETPDLPGPLELGSAEQPAGLEGDLRPYQVEGFGWLDRMAMFRLGSLLADDMGLGKTVTTIALMLSERDRAPGSKTLVIAPLSLLSNWLREIHRFAPRLRVYVHHGGERALTRSALDDDTYDVALTTYDTLVNDRAVLAQVSWRLLVCDEAQNVKNAATRRWAAVDSMPRRTAVMLTGTPVENRMDDICAILGLTVPTVVSSPSALARRFDADPDGLRRFVRPLMLRRRIEAVARDLPELIEQTLWLTMTPSEVSAYLAVVDDLRSRGAGPLEVISALRRAAAHPALVDSQPLPRGSLLFRESSKLSALLDRLGESVEVGERSLVFVAWHAFTDALAESLPAELGVPVLAIDGRTPAADRGSIVDTFNTGPTGSVLVLSPRAAGVGLNLQGASRVHHLTLDWNPAVEAQATARAYRTGQRRTVHVTRYAYGGTVDEQIELRLDQKLDLIERVVEANSGDVPTVDEVQRLLALTPATWERNAP